MDMQGVASIALLPSGSISGHFVDSGTSKCFGLFGTQISCERECSRGEDYRLIDLSILDYSSRKERQVIVECRGHDAARFQNATDVHGWEEDVMKSLQNKSSGAGIPIVKFECEILKADEDAEEHIIKYLPSLIGRGAVVNVGTMEIKRLKFEKSEETQNGHCQQESSGAEHLSCHEDDAEKDIGDDFSLPILKDENEPPVNDELSELLQEELEVEGLSRNQEINAGWPEKRSNSNATG